MHFSVLVIHGEQESVEGLLAPYDEGTCDPRLLEFEEDGEFDVDPKAGKRGYWFNPQAKWDWWAVGGRWARSLPLKHGTYADSARIGDLDLEAMRRSRFRTFSVVQDGEWEDVGLWWAPQLPQPTPAQAGFVDDRLASADPDLIATLVDCHI